MWHTVAGAPKKHEFTKSQCGHKTSLSFSGLGCSPLVNFLPPRSFGLQHPQCNVYLIACNSSIYRQVPQGLFIVLPHCLLHGMVVNIFHNYCIATWFLILKEHSLDECSKSSMRGHVLICLYSLCFVILTHKNEGKKFHPKNNIWLTRHIWR